MAIVDSDGEVLEAVECRWPIVVGKVVLDVRLETVVKLGPQSVIIPIEEGGKRYESDVVLGGGTGLL